VVTEEGKAGHMGREGSRVEVREEGSAQLGELEGEEGGRAGGWAVRRGQCLSQHGKC